MPDTVDVGHFFQDEGTYYFGKASLADLEALIDMRITYLQAELGALDAQAEAETRHQLRPFFERHVDLDLLIYVARCDGRIVGSVFLMLYEHPPRPDRPMGRHGVVYNVVTVEAHRGQGIATNLVQMLLIAGRSLGLDDISLHATAQGKPIYKRLGFVEDACDRMVYKFT